MVSSSRKHLIIKQTKTFRFHRDIISISACFVWPIVVGWECDTQNLHVLRVEQSYSASAASKVVELFFLSLSALFHSTLRTHAIWCVLLFVRTRITKNDMKSNTIAPNRLITHITRLRHIVIFRGIARSVAVFCASLARISLVCVFSKRTRMCVRSLISLCDYCENGRWRWRHTYLGLQCFGGILLEQQINRKSWRTKKITQ